jgi:hypothetical protein
LHFWIAEVCKVAVSVDADDTKFPDDWLFKYRWVSQAAIFGSSTHGFLGQAQRVI